MLIKSTFYQEKGVGRMNKAQHTAHRLMNQRKVNKVYYDEWTLNYIRSKIGRNYFRCDCGNDVKGVIENGVTVYKCSDCGAKIISRQDRIKLKGGK